MPAAAGRHCLRRSIPPLSPRSLYLLGPVKNTSIFFIIFMDPVVKPRDDNRKSIHTDNAPRE
ncbi:MAG: palindromic element RPE4 domain-containing protein [Rickettsia slovaca]